MKKILYFLLCFLWNYTQGSGTSSAPDAVNIQQGIDVNTIQIAQFTFAKIRANEDFIKSLPFKPDQDIFDQCSVITDAEEQLQAALFALGGAFGDVDVDGILDVKDGYLQQLEDSQELIQSFALSNAADPWEHFTEVCQAMYKRLRLMVSNEDDLFKEIAGVHLEISFNRQKSQKSYYESRIAKDNALLKQRKLELQESRREYKSLEFQANREFDRYSRENERLQETIEEIQEEQSQKRTEHAQELARLTETSLKDIEDLQESHRKHTETVRKLMEEAHAQELTENARMKDTETILLQEKHQLQAQKIEELQQEITGLKRKQREEGAKSRPSLVPGTAAGGRRYHFAPAPDSLIEVNQKKAFEKKARYHFAQKASVGDASDDDGDDAVSVTEKPKTARKSISSSARRKSARLSGVKKVTHKYTFKQVAPKKYTVVNIDDFLPGDDKVANDGVVIDEGAENKPTDEPALLPPQSQLENASGSLSSQTKALPAASEAAGFKTPQKQLTSNQVSFQPKTGDVKHLGKSASARPATRVVSKVPTLLQGRTPSKSLVTPAKGQQSGKPAFNSSTKTKKK